MPRKLSAKNKSARPSFEQIIAHKKRRQNKDLKAYFSGRVSSKELFERNAIKIPKGTKIVW